MHNRTKDLHLGFLPIARLGIIGSLVPLYTRDHKVLARLKWK
jgi:hypothetical protein